MKVFIQSRHLCYDRLVWLALKESPGSRGMRVLTGHWNIETRKPTAKNLTKAGLL